jgi:predicted aspartyl protease
MKHGAGYFDPNGNPCLKFHLCGINHPPPGIEFTGIIDTGFTGCLHVPMQHAFALGLPLHGTAAYSLANDSKMMCLLTQGMVTFAGETLGIVVSLEHESKDILIGMDFLRRFGLSLMVGQTAIHLFDAEYIESAVERALHEDVTA